MHCGILNNMPYCINQSFEFDLPIYLGSILVHNTCEKQNNIKHDIALRAVFVLKITILMQERN